MKKFNEEMYKKIKKEGYYEDQYYKYIVIDKNAVFKSWKSSYLSSIKYEFFGIIDSNKKDIFTLENTKALYNEITEEAKKQALDAIIKNYNFYVNIQKNVFNNKLEDESFKRSIISYYIDGYSKNAFSDLYVSGKKPEDLKKELLQYIINIKNNVNEEAFLKRYLTEKKEDIIQDYYKAIFNGVYLDQWNFNYNWNNGIPEDQKIQFNFNNYISMELNKIDYIIKEYTKIYNDPPEHLKKSKKLYKLCNEFKEKNDNKTCDIYLKNDLKLKCIDFDYLITIFNQGKEKAISYRLLTGPERYQLEKFNEEKGRGTREDDLFIEDIKRIEFNKNIIYMEG